jgi:KaiC/GvpD/RAD55 family RecA-like ATPase
VKAENEALESWLSGEGGDDDLGAWMGDESVKAGKPAEPGKKEDQKPKEDGQDALRKWLSGEDETLEDWLGGAQDKPKKKAADVGTMGRQLTEKDKLLDQREQAIKSKEEELEALKLEMEETKKAMESAIGKIDLGEFDAIKLLEENAKTNKELHLEIKKRKQLEEEIEKIKKGSLAVVKYVKSQQAQGEGGAAKSLKKKLDEEKGKREALEAKVRESDEIIKALKAEIEAGLAKLPAELKDAKKLSIENAELRKRVEAVESELKRTKEDMARKLRNGASSTAAESEFQQRMAAELNAKEQEMIRKEGELKQRIIELEEKVNGYEIDNKLQREKDGLTGKSDQQISAELEMKLRELQVKEKALLVREDEIARLNVKIKMLEAEMKSVKEPMAFKEQEMLRREEDLVYREQLLMEERRKVEEAMRESGSMEAHQMKKKLEELQTAITRKEEEIIAKEKYLSARMDELKLREKGVIEDELERREEDRKLELTVEKVKTGDKRLDELLYGGIPFATNVLIYGPAFTGKEVTMSRFAVEGLAKGVPVIMVITDKVPAEIRDDMGFIVQGLEEYERLGLLKFVDSYSRSIGLDDNEPSVTYIDSPTDTVGIMKAVDGIAKELLKTHKYYRLVFRSVSSMIAHMDAITVYKFLQPFCGKRKRDRSVCMYSIEKGMVDEQDIQKIMNLMDGMIDYKSENLKTSLQVRGIGKVQSQGWIEYQFSKAGLTLGSFSLDFIA